MVSPDNGVQASESARIGAQETSKRATVLISINSDKFQTPCPTTVSNTGYHQPDLLGRWASRGPTPAVGVLIGSHHYVSTIVERSGVRRTATFNHIEMFHEPIRNHIIDGILPPTSNQSDHFLTSVGISSVDCMNCGI